jgi:uncharacterized protein (TIGR03382 family)
MPVSDVDARIGLAAQAGDTVVIYAGTGVSEAPTGPSALDGAVELARVELPDGAACVEVSLTGEFAGLGWVQAVFSGADGDRLGAPVEVFAVAPAADTTPRIADTEAGGCGCAATPPVPWASALGLLVLARRRRG